MMTPKRRKRLTLIVLMVAGIAIAAGFALKAFNENLMFFYTPSDIVAGDAPIDEVMNLLAKEAPAVLIEDGASVLGILTRFDLITHIAE